MRQTITTYATNLPGILDRPSQVQVKTGTTTVAQTNYAYDQGLTGIHGNPTTITRSTDATNSVNETFTYNTNGTVATHKDVKQNTTSFTYGECNSTFPTQVSLPLSLSRTMHWDCNGGVLLWSKDENVNQTTNQYTDSKAWRITETDYPDGGWTKYAYNFTTPLSWNLVTTQNLDGTNTRVATSYLDGLGRVNSRQ
jgi:hypothetical protein